MERSPWNSTDGALKGHFTSPFKLNSYTQNPSETAPKINSPLNEQFGLYIVTRNRALVFSFFLSLSLSLSPPLSLLIAISVENGPHMKPRQRQNSPTTSLLQTSVRPSQTSTYPRIRLPANLARTLQKPRRRVA